MLNQFVDANIQVIVIKLINYKVNPTLKQFSAVIIQKVKSPEI